MKDEIKEIYLSNENSRFIGTHDNMGCVMVNGILTKNITYEEYVNIISKAKYFLLVDKDYITNLQEENEDLKIDNKRLQHNEKVFKSRNEKAIEYINNCPEYLWTNVNTKVLLNILQGEENDK